MGRIEKVLENVPREIKDEVRAELKRIKEIGWFKPLELNGNIKGTAEQHVADALKLFGTDENYAVIYKELSSSDDWKGVEGAALASTLEAVWDASQLRAERTPQDTAYELALDAAEGAARRAGAEKDTAVNVALEEARNAAQDLLCIINGIKNPFASLVSLCEMGFYVVGPTPKKELILYYVPKK